MKKYKVYRSVISNEEHQTVNANSQEEAEEKAIKNENRWNGNWDDDDPIEFEYRVKKIIDKKQITKDKGFFKNYKQIKRIGKKNRNHNGLTYSFIEPIGK